jgi:hypothetical protein
MGSGGLQVRKRVEDALKKLRRRMRRGGTIMTAADEDDLRCYLKAKWPWGGFDPDPPAAHLRVILLTTWRALLPEKPGQRRKWDSRSDAALGRDYFAVRRKYPEAKRMDKVAFHLMRTEAPWSQRYGPGGSLSPRHQRGLSDGTLGRRLQFVFGKMRSGRLLPKLMNDPDVKERLLKWHRRGKKRRPEH